jgi:O-antigen ligase
MGRLPKERALPGFDPSEQHAPVGLRTRIAAWCLFATVALAPLPFGSNDAATIAFWCLVLGACVTLAPVPTLGAGQFALVIVAGVVVAAYALVLHEQLADRSWLAAAPHPLWREAASNLALPLQPSVAIARDQPWFELGRPLLCILAIAGGFVVGADRNRARLLVKVIAWSGVAYAAYGILSHLLDPSRILWREKQAYVESVTGTFINHNTAATYFGSCAVAWSLLLWERLRLEMPDGPLRWGKMAMRLSVAAPKEIVIAFAMLFLCLAAMFMTGSRAGVVLSLLALTVGFILFFRRDLPRRSGLWLALVGAAAAALVLLQVMGGGVNARFDAEGVADAARLKTYAATWRMIVDHPWFGTGQGTFAYAFPAYRSADNSMWGVWDIAHNTVLEIAADMGLPVAALVVVAWIVILVVLLRGAVIRRRDRIIPIAAAAVGLLAALHSLVDFSLQIPGYAIVALALIGAGLAQSFVSQRSRRPGHAIVLDAGDVKPSLRALTARAPAEDRATAAI